MKDITVNEFRKKRGKGLAKFIDDISTRIGRKVKILDVGGRHKYWDNVPVCEIDVITILNNEQSQLETDFKNTFRFDSVLGDATNLAGYSDQSIDLVHSNSVIEHVGHWAAVKAMASETRRVGVHGWIQTPAWEFPIEPHYRAPFVHWFGAPARRAMVSKLPFGRGMNLDELRELVDWINILSRREVSHLFPNLDISTERLFLLPKSYTVTWGQK